MILNEQQKRYITLDGTPVNTPRLLGLACRADLQAGVLATAFNTAAAYQSSPGNAAIAFAMTVAGVALAEVTRRRADADLYGKVFGTNHKELCIDKKPDGKTPPTSPRNIQGANIMSASSRFMLSFYAVATTLLSGPIVRQMAQLAATGAPAGPITYMAVGMIATRTTELAATYLRFERVQDLKWNIVDMPKPLEKKVDVKVGGFFPQMT